MGDGFRKRGKNSWEFSIYVTDPATGERKRKWYTVRGTKKQAEQERARLLRERDTGMLVADPTAWTVQEYLDHWLDTYVVQNCGPKMEVGYRSIVKNRIVPFIGAVQLAKLTPAHVREMEAKLLKEGRPGGRPLSVRSVEQVHRVLSEALSHAVEWQMIPRNVCDTVDAPRPKRKEIKVWNDDEARRFLDAVTATKPDGSEAVPYGTALAFALQTGCRLGEACGLRWQDVSFEQMAVQIQQTLQRIPSRGLVVGQPKTARSRRRITLPTALIELLRRHKARQNAWRLQLGPAWRDSGLVFCTPLGTPLEPRNSIRVFEQTVARLGLPRISFHGLRHTHATLLLLANVNPKIVSERLGYSTVSLTLDTYSHVLPGVQDSAVRALEGVFNQAAGGQR